MYRAYRTKADFWFVYIREAHVDTVVEGPPVEQPRSMDERRDAASRCVDAIGLGIPVLVDDMEDTVSEAYEASPFRMVLLAPGGEIVWLGGLGPERFLVGDLESALAQWFARE